MHCRAAARFDVYIADQVWLPEFYQKGFIKDLSGSVSDADKADFSKTAIETVTYDGALVALPIMVHNCAMYYRTDLFEKAGLSGPPKSWDEYRAFAKKTTDAANGIYGTMVCSKQGIEAATRLHSFYQQAGGDLLGADGAPTINSDAGRAALEFMVRARVRRLRRPRASSNCPTCRASGSRASWRWHRCGRTSTASARNRWAPTLRSPQRPDSSIQRARSILGALPRRPGRRTRCGDRVHQMGDQHRPALWLRQGVAQPGAAARPRSI